MNTYWRAKCVTQFYLELLLAGGVVAKAFPDALIFLSQNVKYNCNLSGLLFIYSMDRYLPKAVLIKLRLNTEEGVENLTRRS